MILQETTGEEEGEEEEEAEEKNVVFFIGDIGVGDIGDIDDNTVKLKTRCDHTRPRRRSNLHAIFDDKFLNEIRKQFLVLCQTCQIHTILHLQTHTVRRKKVVHQDVVN